MKNIFFAIIVSLLLIACAGTEPKGKSMSDDLGSTEKVALLRERANEFWSAFVKRDYERVYDIYDPFFQSRTAKKSFVGQLGTLQYHDFEFKEYYLQSIEAGIAKY